MNKKIFVMLFIVSFSLTLIPLIDNVYAQEIPDGEGTEAEPYILENWHHLDYIREDQFAYYILGNDIDETSAGYDELVDTEEGWLPIEVFQGNLDGKDYGIYDLYINRNEEDEVGFIANGNNANFSNLNLNVNVSGSIATGGLVGQSFEDNFENITVTGELYAYDAEIGGVAGKIEKGELYNIHSEIHIQSKTNETTTNNVLQAGGIVGDFLGGTMEHSHAESIIETNLSDIGGVAGKIGYEAGQREVYLYNVSSNSIVEGWDNVGGITGAMVYDSEIENSYSTSEVYGNHVRTGGLVGEVISGNIIDSYSVGYVEGGSNVGGLVGVFENGDIINSYVKGDVGGQDNIGGLVGISENVMIYDSYSINNVNGEDIVGGLVGNVMNSVINNSYTEGSITGINSVGGLVGATDNSLIESSYSIRDIGGEDRVGGLIGEMLYNNTVYETFSSGNIDGLLPSGFVGVVLDADNIIKNSYSLSEVVGEQEATAFTLAIDEYATNLYVENFYSAGKIRKLGESEPSFVGYIFVDDEQVDFVNTFYNQNNTLIEHSTIEGVESGVALPHKNMIGTEAETYMDFDYEEIWTVTTNFDGFPTLQSIDEQIQKEEQKWAFIDDISPEDNTIFEVYTTEVLIETFLEIHNYEEINYYLAEFIDIDEYDTLDEQTLVGEPDYVSYNWEDLEAGEYYWRVFLHEDEEKEPHEVLDNEFAGFEIEGETAPEINIIEPENVTYRTRYFPMDVDVLVEMYGHEDFEYNCTITDNGNVLTEIVRTTEDDINQSYETVLEKEEPDTHQLEVECYTVDETNTENVTYSVDTRQTITGMLPTASASILALIPIIFLAGGAIYIFRFTKKPTFKNMITMGIILVILAIALQYILTVIV